MPTAAPWIGCSSYLAVDMRYMMWHTSGLGAKPGPLFLKSESLKDQEDLWNAHSSSSSPMQFSAD